jgi:UDP-MurNAc hydroxylase
MKIRLVSHASVIIETRDTSIWCDPWLTGRAFNDSWALFPPPVWSDDFLEKIDFLWFSHEHPDHFNIPTLKSLPKQFQERVTVLFQKNNSDKMFDAFRQLGFRHFHALPHRRATEVTPSTSVYCYQQGVMNSCLGVLSQDRNVLNVNDAEINSKDCKLIVRDIGSPDVVLNQFSIAIGPMTADYASDLKYSANRVAEAMLANHRDLQAKVTIPFASFIYFCRTDNRYLNDLANRPSDIARRFREQALDLAIMSPGDVYEVGIPYDSADALRRLDETYRQIDQLPYDTGPTVKLDEIRQCFSSLCEQLHRRYPRFLLSRITPFRVRIPDLQLTAALSIVDGTFEELGDPEADAIIPSDVLYFALKYPYGFQTLFISGCYRILHEGKVWFWLRAVGALNNAEINLRPAGLFSRRSIKYFLDRSRGGFNQLLYQLQRLRPWNVALDAKHHN